jgi:hypothetical protein
VDRKVGTTVVKLGLTTALVAGALVGPMASPASAAIAVDTAGSTVQVGVTGAMTIDFTCPGGNFAAAGVLSAPTIACSAVTIVEVVGDGAAQVVNGAGLNAAAFSSGPRLDVSLAGGNDTVSDTNRADTILTGAGNDFVGLTLGAADLLVNLGADDDSVTARTRVPAVMEALSTGTNATIVHTVGGTLSSTLITGAERLQLDGSDGNDELDVAGISLASSIDRVTATGQGGNDLFTGGPVEHAFYGGTGTNRFELGASTAAAWSASATDTIVGHPSGNGWIYDYESLRSGGRTLQGMHGGYRLSAYANDGDTVARIRPTAGGGMQRTYSLHRTGQQAVPAGIGGVTVSLSYVGQVRHRNIADVVLGEVPVHVNGQLADVDILDVTVPVGSWTTSPGGDTVTVTPSVGTLDGLTSANIADYRVHPPWTDRNQGFAHRVHRDLLFRFASDAWRDQTRDQLAAGTRTRTQVVNGLMATEEFRGVEVDRVFVDFLGRPADPSGKAYWIRSLGSGKTMRTFRAQLFGSNEYFTKAGGTNEAFMRRAYNDVMGRNPDPAGFEFWVNRLNRGAERGGVVANFLGSTEARRTLTNTQFLRFLDRTATPAEESQWIATLGNGRADGERALVAFLAASNAYYQRT